MQGRLPVFADALSSLEELESILFQRFSQGDGAAAWLSCRMLRSVDKLNPEKMLMKKTIVHAVAALFLVLIAAPLFAVQRNAVDEVIRMTKAGVAEETMLDYLAKTDAKIVVTGDDIIAMNDANVPKTVIKAVVDGADARRNYRDRSYSSPRVVVTSPYYYDPYYYDPFYYRPSLSFGLGFGYFGGFRGGFRGHVGHIGGGHHH